MAASTASSPLTAFLHRHDARTRRRSRFVVAAASTADAEPSPEGASSSSTAGPGKKKTVDTRIHWSDPDEGWVGGKEKKEGDGRKDEPMGRRFADLINNPSLGIAPGADIEEIKAAYRRLSKEYHPDTTKLPLKSASEKFIRLREVYNVLSKEESRRFYDWTLAREAESRRLQQLRSRLEDPYELDIQNYEPVPDTVDRLGGKKHGAQRPGHHRPHVRHRHHHLQHLLHHLCPLLQGAVLTDSMRRARCYSIVLNCRQQWYSICKKMAADNVFSDVMHHMM